MQSNHVSFSLLANSQSQTSQTPASATKGYLYEIKHGDQLLGYLFGSIHELAPDLLNRLDQRVLNSFDQCTHAFFEIYENEKEFLNPQYQPQGVDDFLVLRALNQGKEIGGLETIETRALIEKALEIKNNHAYYALKARFLAVYTLERVITKYDWLHKEIIKLDSNPDSLENIYKIIDELHELLKFIVEAITDQKYLIPTEVEKLKMIAGEVPKVLALFDIIDKDQLNFLNEKLKNQIDSDEKNDQQKVYNQIVELYCQGSEAELSKKPLEGIEKALVEVKRQLDIKKLQARDDVMISTIDNDLKKTLTSNTTRCGFYTIGAAHIINTYKNDLLSKLIKKGWTIKKINELQAQSDLSDKRHTLK